VSDRFEAGEARVQVQPSAVPVIRRVVVLVGLLFYANVIYTPLRALHNIVTWFGGARDGDPSHYWFTYGYLADNALALAVHLGIVAMAAGIALALARGRRAASLAPAGPVAVRADAAGLHADDRLVVPRADVASVDVAVDADVGFAVVVKSRDGATTRVPLRSESDARALAAALDPARAEEGALVFEGVAGRRLGETLVAAAAAAGIGAVGVWHWFLEAMIIWPLVRRALGPPGFDVRHPLAAAAIELGVECTCIAGFIALAVLATKPILRRLRPGRVTLDRAGVAVGEGKAARRIAREDIARVDVDDSPEVKLALRDGSAVRLRFSAERPVLERDAFAARVRAIMAEAPIETYSAAETSGVRVALKADEPESESEEEADVEVQAPRARRR
jgi:hypothetical protein